MQEKFGKRNYYISPDTYLLPDEFADFFAEFHQLKNSEGRKPLWIVKPNASSQGKGIYLIDDVNDIDLDESCIISKYIPNPLLINGHKFDLRVYVLVTSFDPLRIYVYKEGLTRFATEEYTTATNKKSRYIHLTNYSVNKKNPNWRTNEELDRDDFGFKWSITALCKHLEQIGIDMNLLWSKVYDLILKSLIAAEHPVLNGMKRNLSYRTNCFEVLGFDILIDSDLKPWLLEINLSPSLSADSPLDFTIKTNLIADSLNLAGVMKFDRKKESINKMKNRMKGSYSGRAGYTTKTGPINLKGLFTDETEEVIKLGSISKELEKQILDLENESKEYKELMIKIARLKHRDLIKEIVYEYERKGNFVRIYPAPGCNEYEKFLQYQKTINKYLYKVLFGGDLVAKLEADMKSNYKLNYEVPKLSSYQQMREEQKIKTKPGGSSEASTTDGSNKLPQINKGTADNSKVVITGDDVLIEYVSRLISKLRNINEEQIGDKEEDCIENFITHYVWHNEDKVENQICDRLQNRLNEMILRRKKLLKSTCKKEVLSSNISSKDALQLISTMIEERESQKSNLLENFTVGYLEEMLKSTTKSIARDVVSTLLPTDQAGVLLTLVKRSSEKSRMRSREMNDSQNDKDNDDDSDSLKDVQKDEEINNKINSNFNPSDPYNEGEILGMDQSSSIVKLPPATQKPKKNVKEGSSQSLRNSMKIRSNSSRPNSKGL